MNDGMTAAEAALELQQIRRALAYAGMLAAGLDQVVAAVQSAPFDPDGATTVRHSALRTRIDLALVAADRVSAYLRTRRD